MKRQRRKAPPGEFHDPLSNYEAPEFDDDLERSLLQDEICQVMICKPFKTIDADATVLQALHMMGELNIACLMVTQDGRLVGIFSERDVLNRVVDQFDTIKDQPIASVMTPDPVVVHETDCPAKALNQMAVCGFRHVPVLTVDERIAGILGPRRVVKYVVNFLKDVT